MFSCFIIGSRALSGRDLCSDQDPRVSAGRRRCVMSSEIVYIEG